MAELNRLLNTDAAARRSFIELLNLDSALAAVATESAADEPLPALAAEVEPAAARAAVSTLKNDLTATALRWAVAAGLLLSVWGGYHWYSIAQTTATVVKEVGVPHFPAGTRLTRNLCQIEAGTLELVTRHGARVVIEAPAEFLFESTSRLFLARGRMSAEVPPQAKGFTVVTRAGQAIDLGTRFGVDVQADGPMEVHVFEGEVIAGRLKSDDRKSLRGGDALTIDGGATTARELRSAAFIGAQELPELTAALAAGQRYKAEAALQTLRADPALIALLDFETEPQASTNQSGEFRTVQGRWPGSRAPEFVEVGDHLKLDVGGDRAYPQLTLAAWVRLDRLGAPYQSLLHTDGWNRTPGQVHWMVIKNATMRLALSRNTMAPGSIDTEHPDSQTSVLHERARWMHLAVTYDAPTGMVRFYLNGRFDKESRQAIAHPARFGPAQIGNWDRSDRKLSGRIDELVILGRVMTDDEVAALFEAGNPYR
jgi:hypothetical protein